MVLQIKNAKIWKVGGSWVVTIPLAFIESELIDINKKYDIEIKEEINKEE